MIGIFENAINSVQGSSCMDQKNDQNWTEPDWRLRLHAFQNEKTAKNRPQPDLGTP